MAGRAKCLSLLLDKGADPNSADRDGRPEVTLATMHGRAKCLSLLLDSGADPNIAMDNGSTALMYAAFSGDTDCAELLLRHEAQVDAIGTIRQRRGTALLHCGITMPPPYHGNNPLHVGRQVPRRRQSHHVLPRHALGVLTDPEAERSSPRHSSRTTCWPDWR